VFSSDYSSFVSVRFRYSSHLPYYVLKILNNRASSPSDMPKNMRLSGLNRTSSMRKPAFTQVCTNFANVSSRRKVSERKATFSGGQGPGCKAKTIVLTRAGMRDGSNTRSAPNMTSEFISFCIIELVTGRLVGSSASDQSKVRYVILGCADEALPGISIFSRQRLRTLSSTSVKQIEPQVDVDVEKDSCWSATIAPSRPIPHPNSRTRFPTTISANPSWI